MQNFSAEITAISILMRPNLLASLNIASMSHCKYRQFYRHQQLISVHRSNAALKMLQKYYCIGLTPILTAHNFFRGVSGA